MSEQLPKGWESATIQNVVEILDAKRRPLNREERDERPGKVPYYGATGRAGWIDEPIFDEELVLLGEDAAPFLDPFKPKAYLIDGPSWVNNHAHVLRAIEGVTSNRYLKHYLNWVPYRGHVTGTTRLKLTQGAMKVMPVRLPGLAEQERMVTAIEEHLSRLEAAAGTVASARSKTSALPSIAMQSLFSNEWPVRKIVEVARVGSGATPKRSEQRYWAGGTVPWVKSGAINARSITAASEMITEQALAETSVKLWPAGTVLVAMYGEGKTRGKAARLGIEATCNQACAAIDYDRSVVDGDYLLAFLNAQYEASRRLASGGVQPNLSLGLIKNIDVPLPDLDEQRRVAQRAERIVQLSSRLSLACGDVRERGAVLRRSILSAAFSGRLVDQDPSDEPASALLARIAAERPAPKTRKKTSA